MLTPKRPYNLGLRTEELRVLAHRSREVVVLASITGAITGVFVRMFDLIVAERLFETLLEADWKWGLIAPPLGLALAAVLLHTVGGGANAGTSDEYIRAFHDRDYPIRWRALVAKIMAAVATLGTGGAMGLEGPSLYTGSAFGALLQRRLPAPFRGTDYRTLMVAGAAAGVAAIFKAPATGAIFALEVPFRDQIARKMLLPALVASASGYLTFVALSGTQPIFLITEVDRSASLFQYSDLLGAILIGIACAIGARLFAKLIRRAKAFTVKPVWTRLLTAAVLVSTLHFVARVVSSDDFNPANGESLSLGSGYHVIAWLFEEHPLWLLTTIFVIRMCSTAATLAGGGVGGVFIPLVVGGAIVGRGVGAAFHTLDPQLYTLLGMAAFLGAGYRVPLAAIMFVAETTGQPGFIVPALFATVSADLFMGPVSITAYQREFN